MLYHGITVEHSYNCMVLLCRLFLGLSGHYTNKIKFLFIAGKMSTSSGNFGASSYTPDLSQCNNVLAAICIGATPEGQFSTSNFWVSEVNQQTGTIYIVNYTGMTKRFIVSELIIYTD